MSPGKRIRIKVLSAVIGVVLLTLYSKSWAASDSPKQKSDYSTLVKGSSFNGRIKRHTADLANSYNLDKGEKSVPSFGNFEKTVTIQRGESAYLHCVVNNLGENKISWVRRKDNVVLTLDRYVLTTDQRFQIIHIESTSDWTLKIDSVQPSDAGVYECRVSTIPDVTSSITLKVITSTVAILGPPQRYAKQGSAIELACVISETMEQPALIFWYHNNKIINYDIGREITLKNMRNNTFISKLSIPEVHMSDSGEYKCDVSDAGVATVKIDVLNGSNKEILT